MDRPPALEPSLVMEFVGKAHADLDRVKELLDQTPALVNATWDWGNGDFESALGAAAHMGRKDIANFLLTNIDCFGIGCQRGFDNIQVAKHRGSKDVKTCAIR